MATRPMMAESRGSVLPTRDALYVSSSENTFANDELLPNLPVPPLDQTLQKYLDSVKALVTEEEYKETERITMEFQNGVGKELHKKLMDKANHERNWLEKWWEEVAYLQQRMPLLPLCSMAGVSNMENIWSPSENSQVERTSLYLHYQLSFWKLLRKELLRPHTGHGVPWSMHQFKRFFSTVRIPGETSDRLECYFHTEVEDPVTPTHIIILHKGHIFTFDVVDEYGEVFTPPEIALQLRRIKDWCQANGEGICVSALTVDDRTKWAKNREYLLKIHPENELHMVTINTSLVVICLDDAKPGDLTEVIRYTLAGDCCNRWADKSVNDVFFADGTFSMISDHTPYDGLVPVVIGHYTYLSVLESGGVWKGIPTVDRDLLPPRRLDFHIDEHIKSAIAESQLNYQILADDCDAKCGIFTQYGKEFLKPYNIHPETYVQFALQYAYYKMHGKPAPTYVTAATRQFYHGRTETLRSCFSEVIDWVHAMVEDTQSSNEKFVLLMKASEKFKALMKDCTKNHGCDRHLLGLYMICVEQQLPVPEIFLDPSWVKSGGSGNFILSTSCCGYTPLGGCVMPMREDGYGTFYNIENNKMTFTISACNRCGETSSSKFFEHIEEALFTMGQLLLSSKL